MSNWMIRGSSEEWMRRISRKEVKAFSGGFQRAATPHPLKGKVGYGAPINHGYWSRHRLGSGGGRMQRDGVPPRQWRHYDGGHGYSGKRDGNERDI